MSCFLKTPYKLRGKPAPYVEPSKTVIQDDVTISCGRYFAAHGKGQGRTDILVSQGACLGMCAQVISGKTGVSIGRNCVVGAGALVTKSIPDGCTAVGVPAHVVRQADDSRQPDPEGQCNTDW
jgi:acetyltransferase-like isoleucine patch superfamily enzyme